MSTLDKTMRANFAAIAAAVGQHYDVPLASLHAGRPWHPGCREARRMCMYLQRRWTRASLRQIASYYGVDHVAVLFACKVIQDDLPFDPLLRRDVDAVLCRLIDPPPVEYKKRAARSRTMQPR